MKTVQTIAWKMIQEAIKMRAPLALLLVLLVLVPTFPLVLKSDGTLKGQMQLAISYSISLTSMVIYLLSLFLSSYSFTGEIKYKQIYLIDCKPVQRWHFILGKFLGVALTNLIFLVLIGSVILIMLVVTLDYSGSLQERADVKDKIFIAYRGCPPDIDHQRLRAQTNQWYKNLQQSGRVPKDVSELAFKETLRSILYQHWQSVTPKQRCNWIFKEIPTDLGANANLKLRYKLFAEDASLGSLYKVTWEIGRGPRKLPPITKRVKSGEFHELTIPASVVSPDKTVEVCFKHEDPRAGRIYFSVSDEIELFYPASSFFGNYCRGLALIFVMSCFLIMLALFASTFLSFPVAILLGGYILCLGLIANFLTEIVPMGTQLLLQEKRTIWETFSMLFLKVLFWLIPDFSQYTPLEYLALGRMIEWSLLGEAIGKVVVLRVGILTLSAVAIFNRRELGKPVV